MYTFKEVKNMASLLWISCTMTILQFKLLLLIYSSWYFLSIHFDVICYGVMRKMQTSQSGFPFWFEHVQQGFIFSSWLFCLLGQLCTAFEASTMLHLALILTCMCQNGHTVPGVWCLPILFLLMSKYYGRRNLPASVDACSQALSFWQVVIWNMLLA